MTEEELFSPRQYRLSLWYFLFDLLEKKGTGNIITWTNREKLEFKIVNSAGLANAWGRIKGKTNMTYPKFARAMRYYYRKNVIQKVVGKRFTYRFIESDLTHDVFESSNLYARSHQKNDKGRNQTVAKEVVAEKSIKQEEPTYQNTTRRFSSAFVEEQIKDCHPNVSDDLLPYSNDFLEIQDVDIEELNEKYLELNQNSPPSPVTSEDSYSSQYSQSDMTFIAELLNNAMPYLKTENQSKDKYMQYNMENLDFMNIYQNSWVTPGGVPSYNLEPKYKPQAQRTSFEFPSGVFQYL